MSADARWMGIHVGIPDFSHVRQRTCTADLRRIQRNHEGANRTASRHKKIGTKQKGKIFLPSGLLTLDYLLPKASKMR